MAWYLGRRNDLIEALSDADRHALRLESVFRMKMCRYVARSLASRRICFELPPPPHQLQANSPPTFTRGMHSVFTVHTPRNICICSTIKG